MMSISIAQLALRSWAARVFDERTAANAPERVLRFVEEAVELAQVCRVTPEQIHRLVDYVFSRPVGDVRQEIAGSLVTLFTAANALDVDAEAAFQDELRRIWRPEVIERIQRRQAEKREVTG